jgi:hypothetical protein
LPRAELEAKFVANARRGGWSEARARDALAALAGIFDGRLDPGFLGGAPC